MIDSIQVGNLKSYRSAHMKLAPLTFLIGANASGKSNALEAIRVLSWLAKGIRLEDLSKGVHGIERSIRGQPADWCRDGYRPFTVGCRLTDAPDGWTDLQIEIGLLSDEQLAIKREEVTKPSLSPTNDNGGVPLYRVDSEPSLHSDEISVMYNNFARGKNKPHIPCSNRQAVFYQLESPGRFESKHEESQRIIPLVTKAFRECLRRIIFLDPRPSRMRDYSYAKDHDMKEDGSNLSSVLYHVCQDQHSKEHLLNFVRSLPEQNIVDVDFIETDRRDVMVRLIESFGGARRAVDSPLLSDGTLRVLAVAALLLGVPAGSFVIIEEIDNGVHPSRAESLVQRIREVAEDRHLQVLVTTHNPALLDALPLKCIGDVLCCYRDPNVGDSRIIRLGDLDRCPELLAQGTLGKLVTQRILDEFVKDRATPEERLSQSLLWLDALDKEAGFRWRSSTISISEVGSASFQIMPRKN